MQRISSFVGPAIRYVSHFIWKTPQPMENNYRIADSQPAQSDAVVPVQNKLPARKIIASYTAFVFSKENHQRIFAAAALTVLGTGLNFLAPYLLGNLIESLNGEKNFSEIDFDESKLLAIISLVGVYTLAQLIPNIRDQVLIPVAAHNNEKLLVRITEHQVKEKSLGYHIKTPQSEQMLLVQKSFPVSEVGTPFLTQVLPAVGETLIASSVFSYKYGSGMGLGIAGSLVFYTLYCAATTKPVIETREKMFQAGNKAWAKMESAISKYKTIWDFNKADETMKEVAKAVNQAAEAEIAARATPLKIAMGHIAIPRLGMLAAALYVGLRVQSQQFTVSEFMALLGYLNQLSSSLPAVGDAMNKIFSSFPDLQYVFGELEKPSEILNPFPDVQLNIDGPPRIEFRDVSFNYPGKPPIFDQLSFIIEPGQCVALVSESGGGKSTIYNLLYRYFSPTAGAIYINHQNIAKVDLLSLQKNIGLVGQNPNLTQVTVRDNIKFGAQDSHSVEDEEILELAKDLNLIEFIDSLPNKLNTEVGEGGKAFSGGQQQKVAISRGFLKDAPIRLLDEITAALDAGSAAEVLEGVKGLSRNKSTTLIITHKLSEITSVDKIIVLDKGKVIAQGTHDQLLKRCALYRALWEKQNQEKSAEKNPAPHLLTHSMTNSGLLKKQKEEKMDSPSDQKQKKIRKKK